MKEVEVKARLRNKTEVQKQLEALGCKFSEPITQKDTIFALPGTPFPAGVGVNILRIREQNGKYIFTLKARLSTGLDKMEREVEVSDLNAAAAFTKALGFEEVITLNKTRQKANYQNWEICLDEVEDLGSFIEMEEMTKDGDSSQIQEQMFEFLKTLGIIDDDQEHYGYDVMLYQKNKLS